jgi:transposase
MLTVDEYARIRRAHYQDGLGIREIARQFHHSRRKIREVLQNSEPSAYPPRQSPAPKLDPVKGLIDAILTEDQLAPPKQRHTASRIFFRLQSEHGYSGGYDQVRRYVQSHRRQARETFIPLDHEPGQRAEADFGQIWVDFPDGRRQTSVMIVTWAWSYASFAIALPTQKTEAILHGLTKAFEFFGCVPRELWWDNPTTVAIQILSGRQRKLNERYLALASHYNFEPLFCMPARGNEKPRVENRVKDLERRLATPVPRAENLDRLNDYLVQCCRRDFDRQATKRQETIGQRFQQDLARSLALPDRPFDPCIQQSAKADKYQTVAFDKNRYSVPHSFAFRTVGVKGYVDRVELTDGGKTIASHRRCYKRDEQILDPRHFLPVLERKPGCLDHSNVFRQWQLPKAFPRLRKILTDAHGAHSGTRQFIRVLLLLDHHPQESLAQAIEHCRARDCVTVEAILNQVQKQARRQKNEDPEGTRDSQSSLSDGGTVLAASTNDLLWRFSGPHVPMPDLRSFDLLLSEKGDGHVDCHADENQFEAVAIADHCDGMGEAWS